VVQHQDNELTDVKTRLTQALQELTAKNAPRLSKTHTATQHKTTEGQDTHCKNKGYVVRDESKKGSRGVVSRVKFSTSSAEDRDKSISRHLRKRSRVPKKWKSRIQQS
jgi:hypothetical protein